MNRQEYILKHLDRYTSWAYEVGNSPYSAQDKVEFAIISAHTPQEAAIDGWERTRESAGVSEIAETLDNAGVLAPYVKASRIVRARELGDIPTFKYREYRKTHKIRGLGYCKLSFACCLIDPFSSDVVCLDTHMLQLYGATERIYSKLSSYEAVENKLLHEARELGCPPFVYQWASWDWKRTILDRKAPDNHSFLWRGGKTKYQLPLFSGLDK